MLAKWGIIGINQRNLAYIFEDNHRQHYPVADSKLLTKELAEKVGVAVPQLFHVIKYQYEAKQFETLLKGRDDFVLKPNHGSGGGGILVITEKNYSGYSKASGEIIQPNEIRYHIQNILSGMYSLGAQPDAALIEQRVAFDPVFEPIAYQGVPDIRVIVHSGEPIMGMLRLPTKRSDGKANLHMGGIGVGINMEKGITSLAAQDNRYVERHPETGELLAGHSIPYWGDIMAIAVKMQKASGLGYIGVDVVLDKYQGPLVLEINARPGLAIQIANQRGLAYSA